MTRPQSHRDRTQSARRHAGLSQHGSDRRHGSPSVVRLAECQLYSVTRPDACYDPFTDAGVTDAGVKGDASLPG